MKRKIFAILVSVLILIAGTVIADSITLPQKMYNQLLIGSGLKGSFVITAEGDRFDTPFINQIKDAEFLIRGIKSGKDIHGYVFQKGNDDQQTAVNEIYKKDGIFYFRSDMVQGTTLAFPTLSQYLEILFPSGSDNVSSSGFVSKLISMPREDREETLDPVLNRYQKELEMWLSNFTVQGEAVKLENGLSALDLSYSIPMSKVNEEIVHLISEFTEDAELNESLKNIMTDQERELYLNGNLLYYYQAALNSINQDRSVRMDKRVSVMGELLRFRMELPLEEQITGYHTFSMEMIDQLTVYTLTGSGKTLLIALPETDIFKQSSYNQSVWFACISAGNETEEEKSGMAYRADIQKTSETHHDDNDTSYQTDHYSIVIEQDTKYLPQDTDLTNLTESGKFMIDAELQYSSKYAQNSATYLNIKAEITEGDSFLRIDGNVHSAKPWLFMPFELIDPVYTGTEKKEVLEPYMTDWISNAASIIQHNGQDEPAQAGTDIQAESASAEKTENPNAEGTQMTEAETVPLDEAGHE